MTPEKEALDAALARFRTEAGPGEALALVYTPSAFHFGRVSASGIAICDAGTEASLRLDGVYEARLFGPQAELHWRRSGVSGRSALKTKAADEIPLTYVLWGEAKAVMWGPGGAWTRMGSSRTPDFWVPFAGTDGKALMLTGFERVETGPDGNAHVVGERLAGLAMAQ